MQPLSIRLRLLTPIAAPLRRRAHPLHLDALLIAVMADQRVFDPAGDDPYAPGTGKVPLAVAGNTEPIYQASVALISGATEQTKFGFAKRAPDIEVQMARGRGKQNKYETGSESGPLKPWKEFPPALAVTAVEFRCVGDKGKIEELIKNIAFVGAFRRCGMGEVISCEVAQVHGADPATWGLFDSGGPLRELPVSDWPSGEGTWIKGAAAVRPPYWYPGNTRLCWIPDPYRTAVPNVL